MTRSAACCRSAASAADLSALPFVEKVVAESMRLYPPAWIIGRRAIDEYPIGGYIAPARSLFLFSPYVVQRDPRFFSDPERFDPDRWTSAFKASLPPFAYFPFGGGPRRCIGESFAWMELVLVVATIAQRWTLRLAPGHPVETQPLVTLRAKHGMRMTLERRSHDDDSRIRRILKPRSTSRAARTAAFLSDAAGRDAHVDGRSARGARCEWAKGAAAVSA
jgi:cytochrome P450